MPHRLLLITIAIVAGAILSAQPAPLTVRITSPVDDGFASGLFRLVAVIEPATAAKQVKELVFFADGKKVCTVTREPFQCDWDAGDRLREHTIRVTAEHPGGRAAATVHTKGVKHSEAVDVDVVQLTAVVTDGDGRFVKGLTPADFKVFDDGKPQAITSFESENISLEMVLALDVSSSMRDALPSVKESAKRFLTGLRPGDQVTLLGFNDNVFTLAPRSRDQGARVKAIDLMRAWGGTALYDVVLSGLNLLSRHPGRRSMLLFSDGDDQSSHAIVRSRGRARGRQRRDHLRDRPGTGDPHAGVADRAQEICHDQRRPGVLRRRHAAPRSVLRRDPRRSQQPISDLHTPTPTRNATVSGTRFESRSGTASTKCGRGRATGCRRTEANGREGDCKFRPE